MRRFETGRSPDYRVMALLGAAAAAAFLMAPPVGAAEARSNKPDYPVQITPLQLGKYAKPGQYLPLGLRLSSTDSDSHFTQTIVIPDESGLKFAKNGREVIPPTDYAEPNLDHTTLQWNAEAYPDNWLAPINPEQVASMVVSELDLVLVMPNKPRYCLRIASYVAESSQVPAPLNICWQRIETKAKSVK